MTENDGFWEFYWELRLKFLQDLGKREAILACSKLIRNLSEQPGQPVRLLELGSGEAQIIGTLVEGHSQVQSITKSIGIDYKSQSISKSRHDYPMLQFIEGDFTDPKLLSHLGTFEIVLMVNALHEVFSAGYSDEMGEINVPSAKQKVNEAFSRATNCIAPGGYLVLFDGLEMPGDIQEKIRIRFLHPRARRQFDTFVREYRQFHIRYEATNDPNCVELSRRDFTRYITKSIFLGKQLWQTERLESYQYFNESEFCEMFNRNGLTIQEQRKLTVDYEKWINDVVIETPEVDFPEEHILIVAKKE